MEQMISKTFMKILNFFGSLLLTIFAGVFGLVALMILVESIINPSIFAVFGCAGFAFAGWACWGCREVLR